MTSPTSVSRRRAYTLLEMLTTVALLVIVLGLTVSLARYVRAESAESLTKSLLQRLEGVMSAYYAANGAAPAVTPLIDPAQTAPLDEADLQRRALRNNQEFLAALRGAAMEGRLRSQVPASAFEDKDHALLDGWGEPIVFMARMHPMVGMAPNDQFFFFSAGPDRRYLTRADNLYSYEGAAGSIR